MECKQASNEFIDIAAYCMHQANRSSNMYKKPYFIIIISHFILCSTDKKSVSDPDTPAY